MNNVDKLFDDIEKREKKYPIRTYFNRKYFAIKNFLTDIPLHTRSFFHRGKKGWSSYDVWGFGGYLATVIKEGLLHLRKIHHGYPANLTEVKWIGILNKMIKTFTLAEGIFDNEILYTPSKDWTLKRYSEMKKLMDEINKKHGGNTRVLNEQEVKEYEEGFDLFQEYFFNLWD